MDSKFSKILFLFLVLVFLKAPAQAQVNSVVSSDGRDFYIDYIEPSYNYEQSVIGHSTFGVYALVSCYTDTKVTVSYFDDVTGVEILTKTYNLWSGTGIQINLDTSKMRMSDPGDIPQYRACHIQADNPVTVQFFNSGASTCGSYLALPTQALGKKYVAASYFDNPVTNVYQVVSEGVFLVIAVFDNTSVTITPNATTKGGHRGMHAGANATGVETPFTIGLNRGQCYLVKSGSSESDVDISGSLIRSNKPVAVIGGQENANIGVVDVSIDSRDFMVEQMIPVDLWDSTGYVSVPLKDSQPADPSNEGAGENYRVYSYDPGTAHILLNELGIGFHDLNADRLSYPPTERFSVTTPVELHSTNGKKFSVIMYDQRNFATNVPYPSPSMNTIIPISKWKKSYSLLVPLLPGNTAEESYINIIAKKEDIESGIKVSFNGQGLKPLKQVLGIDGSFKSIPDHPELSGIRFTVFPGNFYMTCSNPFMLYTFGFVSDQFDHDVPPDGDEFYDSYANPAGALLFSGDSVKLRTVIDSQCSGWNICVYDDRKNDPGIRNIALLSDPKGIQYSPAKESYNCHLDPILDPNNFGEVQLDGTNSNLCFKIEIDNPLGPAYAAFLLTDNAGNMKLTELHYSPPVFSRTPNTSSINFSNAAINTDTCISLSIKNSESLAHTVLSAKLSVNNRFSISSVKPALPAILKKNDSVVIKICYSSRDTLKLTNDLAVLIDCYTVPVKLIANGSTGLISATDQDFGKTDTGKSISRSIDISNIGTRNFTVTKNWKLTGSKAFVLTDSALLPTVLNPGASIPLRITYRPKTMGYDTATITWITDIESPYSQQVKSFSRLIAQANVPIALVSKEVNGLKLSIRPNPASGSSIILSITDKESAMEEVSIYDLLGRELYKKNILMSANTPEDIELPIITLPNGTYYARISSAGKIVTEKFEVQR